MEFESLSARTQQANHEFSHRHRHHRLRHGDTGQYTLRILDYRTDVGRRSPSPDRTQRRRATAARTIEFMAAQTWQLRAKQHLRLPRVIERNCLLRVKRLQRYGECDRRGESHGPKSRRERPSPIDGRVPVAAETTKAPDLVRGLLTSDVYRRSTSGSAQTPCWRQPCGACLPSS